MFVVHLKLFFLRIQFMKDIYVTIINKPSWNSKKINLLRIRLLFLLMLILPISPSYSKEPPVPATPMLNISVGQVAVFDKELQSQRYGLEYRFRPYGKYQLIPAIGFAFSENNDSFIYSDLRHDFWLNNHWVVTPSIGAGVFSDGNKIDLGNDIEFRSGLEVAYRFKNNYRLGLALFHLSNAGTANQNPGTEALVLSVSLPIGR